MVERTPYETIILYSLCAVSVSIVLSYACDAQFHYTDLLERASFLSEKKEFLENSIQFIGCLDVELSFLITLNN